MKIAAITTIYNDEDFLPHYLDHYGPEVDTIFAIDNGSDDRSLEILRACPKVVLSSYDTGGKFNMHKKNDTIMAKVRECAGEFDYALVPDADEFLVHKGHGTIRGCLTANRERKAFGTQGFNIFSYPDDPPYDPSKPLLQQRRRGIPSPEYSKPIILRPDSGLVLGPGRHEMLGVRNPKVDDPRDALFYLLHYRGFDEALYLKRCRVKAKRNDVDECIYSESGDAFYLTRFRQQRDSMPPVRVI